MGMILKNVVNDKYTFENEYGKIFEFTWEEVRSIATALLIEYLKEDVGDSVDQMDADCDINLGKLKNKTPEQFKDMVVNRLSSRIIEELSCPDMDTIYYAVLHAAEDLGIKEG